MPNQYFNTDNAMAHYKSTGPEFGNKPKEELHTFLQVQEHVEPLVAQVVISGTKSGK
jgi:cysteine synthase